MKDLFPGYFKDDGNDIKKIWEECLFVFDANIMLNLYRYSDPTRKSFFESLESIKDRVWLPNRVAEEYLFNRLIVIGQQEKAYEDTVGKIDALKKDLDNSRSHPFVSKSIMKKIDSIFIELKEELSRNKKVHEKRIRNDEIKQTISNIFEGKVGVPYEREELEKVIVNGEQRYKDKIPPGYNDVKKGGDSESFSDRCRKFGDLIVWKQILDRAMSIGCNVVLVTDDAKDDWWEIFKGKTIGPRPELIDEFKKFSGNEFYMYKADRFLEVASERLGGNVSNEAVEEIREIRRRDIENVKNLAGFDEEINSYSYSKKLIKNKALLFSELSRIESQLKRVELAMFNIDDQIHDMHERESNIIDSSDSYTKDAFLNVYNGALSKKSHLQGEIDELNAIKKLTMDRLDMLEGRIHGFDIKSENISNIDRDFDF